MTVRLNAQEYQLAAGIAALRSCANRSQGVGDRKIGPGAGILADIDGMCAEVAFCKLANVFPDLGVRPRSGSADCLVGGLLVDVKATRYPEGSLVAASWKKIEDAGAYVLMVGEGTEWRFAGWAESIDLIGRENLSDLGHGPSYRLPQHRLCQSLDALLALGRATNQTQAMRTENSDTRAGGRL